MLSEAFSPAILVLAAGQSVRFGGVKVLAPIDKAPMFLETLQKLPSLPTFVATGIHHELIVSTHAEQELKHPVTWLNCQSAKEGLGHTIAESVSKLIESHSFSHLFIVLADQVALRKQDFETLLNTAKTARDKLVCCEFDHQFSVPAIFPSAYLSGLCELQGDKGAKALLNKNKSNLISLKLERAKVDIDTQDELKAWQQRLTKQPLSETT